MGTRIADLLFTGPVPRKIPAAAADLAINTVKGRVANDVGILRKQASAGVNKKRHHAFLKILISRVSIISTSFVRKLVQDMKFVTFTPRTMTGAVRTYLPLSSYVRTQNHIMRPAIKIMKVSIEQKSC